MIGPTTISIRVLIQHGRKPSSYIQWLPHSLWPDAAISIRPRHYWISMTPSSASTPTTTTVSCRSQWTPRECIARTSCLPTAGWWTDDGRRKHSHVGPREVMLVPLILFTTFYFNCDISLFADNNKYLAAIRLNCCQPWSFLVLFFF